MTWLPRLALVGCTLPLAAAGLGAWGSRRWAGRVRKLSGRLDAGGIHEVTRHEVTRDESTRDETCRPPPAARFDARELEGLPEPVQRYFGAVLQAGQPMIAAATIELAGTFNLSATGERWKPFTSWQRVVTRRPGFLWNGRIAMAPGMPVRVVDGYIAGQGLLHAAVLGLVTVARQEGRGEMARGELMRFFAEMAWYPTALLPSQGVQWQPADATSAYASLVDGPLGLTLLFRFDDAGLIASVRAEARGALVGRQMHMLPWEGCWSNYQTHGTMRVPLTGEAAWCGPEGRRPYFRGTVTSLAYEFVP